MTITGLMGIQYIVWWLTDHLPGPGLDFLLVWWPISAIFFSRSFKTILRWGSKEFLKMFRWIFEWIFKVSRSKWKTFASCTGLSFARRSSFVSFHNVILHVMNSNNLCHRLVNTTQTRDSSFPLLLLVKVI